MTQDEGLPSTGAIGHTSLTVYSENGLWVVG